MSSWSMLNALAPWGVRTPTTVNATFFTRILPTGILSSKELANERLAGPRNTREAFRNVRVREDVAVGHLRPVARSGTPEWIRRRTWEPSSCPDR